MNLKAPVKETNKETAGQRKTKTAASATRELRWIGAVVVLVSSAVALLGYRYGVCSTSLLPGAPTATECRPPVIADAATVIVVLIVFILLLPELSEVSAFGVSLKKKVEAAERDASEAKAKVYEIQTTLVNFISSSSSASAQINQNVYYDSADLRRMVKDQGAEHKAAEDVEGTADSQSTDGDDEATAVPSSAEKSLELIRDWERLRTLFDVPTRGGTRPPDKAMDWILGAARRGFYESNQREIETVRAVRNRVAHAIHVSEADLNNALALCRYLLAESENLPGSARA